MVVILILIGWLAAHEWHADRVASNQARQSASSAPVTPGERTPPTAHAMKSPTVQAASRQAPGAQTRAPWRVIAFTYNVGTRRKRKPPASPRPIPMRQEVFTPTGHAPYLVTVGGTMNKDEAFAFVRKVRRPRPATQHLRAKL